MHNCLSQSIAYLKDIGQLEATPEQEFIDPEEKREKEQREAIRIHAGERKPRGNPYSQ